MTPSKLTALVAAGILTAAIGATAVAAQSMSAAQAVAARQAAMKQDGRALRGANGFTGDKAVAALTTVQKNYTELQTLFPKDSITDKSVALPVIWDRFDEFNAIFKKGAAAAADGIAAAKAGDTAKYQASIKLIAGTCNECHDTFRAKQDD